MIRMHEVFVCWCEALKVFKIDLKVLENSLNLEKF
jgi:hypothetical protein